MSSVIIGYKLISGIFCLDRPINNVPYSMIRIDGKLENLERFAKIIKKDEKFENSLLKKYDLRYRNI